MFSKLFHSSLFRVLTHFLIISLSGHDKVELCGFHSLYVINKFVVFVFKEIPIIDLLGKCGGSLFVIIHQSWHTIPFLKVALYFM